MLPFKEKSSSLSQDLGLSVPKMLALDSPSLSFCICEVGTMSPASPFFCNQGVSSYLEPPSDRSDPSHMGSSGPSLTGKPPPQA